MNIRDTLRLAPVLPVLVVEEIEHAVPLARALFDGGLPVLEITLRTPVALQVIEAIRKAIPDAIIGAGTLNHPDDFARCESAGAQFAVTAGLTPALAEAANSVHFPLVPGVMTPSEVLAARLSGYDTLKFFPAQQAGGLPMLQALAGPFADVAFVPSGGITPDTAPGYLSQPNVLCVCGSWVAPGAMVRAHNWKGIEALAREARKQRP